MIPTAEVVSAEDYNQNVSKYVVSESDKMAALKRLQIFPEALRDQFRVSCSEFAHRYWIIDNSGSMGRSDGKRIVSSGGRTKTVTSTRWAELGDSLMFHASVAANLGAPTDFRLLNPPAGSPQNLSIGFGYPREEMKTVQDMVTTNPVGRTPLCAKIREVVQMVAVRQGEFRANGTRALVVIASDGEPSDGNVEAALQPLKDLPVHVVVRLCTDEQNVVDFWAKVDEDLEFPLDVLDDIIGEAEEIHERNPYLAYGLPLHRLREWGCSSVVIDLLDESKLTTAQLQQLIVFLYGNEMVGNLPHPDFDWTNFVKALSNAQRQDPESVVWDPRKNKLASWIDISKLNKAYNKKGCSLM